MRRRIFCRRMILIALLLAALMLDHQFGLLDRGPRFRFRSTSAWSSAIKRGDTVFDYPLDPDGRLIYQFEPGSGESSYYLRRLRRSLSFIWPVRCDNSLRQGTGEPDGMCHMGNDVNPAAAPILIQLLNDDDERVRNEAAFAIGVIGDRADTSSAIPPLIAMLKGSRRERLNAASALCRLGERANAAIPALIEAREGDDPKIREIASEALHRIAPASFPAN